MADSDSIEFKSKKKTIKIIIEPSWFYYEIKPGEKIKIEGQSEVNGKLQFQKNEGTTVICQWDCSTLKVFINDILDTDLDTQHPILLKEIVLLHCSIKTITNH